MKGLDAARWAVLNPRVDELLALPPQGRARRLQEIAAEDPQAAVDLQRFLVVRDEASEVAFLHKPAAAASWPAAAAVGEQVGHWTLAEPIGEGGMGSVWRARRNDGRFEGEAAVKLLKSGLFDAVAQERFRREGAILSRLRHPGIAQLFDAGVTAKGQPYLVLELVRGEAIDSWADSRSLGVRQRIELFVQVLDAVAAAHGQLVIHRDLKPSNVLVDETGRVKLLDFGIARLLAADERTDGETLTREGALLLTPPYAAPEQFEGGVLSMATDVYALGVVLYKLLSGSHPSGLPDGSTAIDYMKAAQQGPAGAASSRAPQRRRELQGDLDNILSTALATAPDARYGSAASFADDLRRHLANEPVSARAATPWYRFAKLVRRRPFETAAMAAVLLAIPSGAHVQAVVLASFGAGTGLALWQLRRTREQAASARRAQARAEAASEFVSFVLSQSGDQTMGAAAMLERAEQLLDRGFVTDPGTKASLLALVGGNWGDMQEYARSRKLLEAARVEAHRAAEPILLARIEGVLGELLGATGHAAQGKSMMRRAVLELRRAGPPACEPLATALSALADVELATGGNIREVKSLAREAMEIASRGPDVRCVLPSALNALAGAEVQLGEVAAAAVHREEALRRLSAAGRDRTIFAVTALNDLGVLYARSGLAQQALAAYEKAAAIDAGLRPDAAPRPVVEINRGKLMCEIGRANDAVAPLERALAACMAQGDRRGASMAELQRVVALTSLGDLPRAAEQLRAAEASLREIYPAGHHIFGGSALVAARIARARGDTAATEAELGRSRDLLAAAPERSPSLIRLLSMWVEIDLARGDIAAARGRWRELAAAAGAFKADFSQSAWSGIAMLTEARVAVAEGHVSAAVPLLVQAQGELKATLGELAPETIAAGQLLRSLPGG